MYKAKEPGKLVVQFKARVQRLEKEALLAQITARRQEKTNV